MGWDDELSSLRKLAIHLRSKEYVLYLAVKKFELLLKIQK